MNNNLKGVIKSIYIKKVLVDLTELVDHCTKYVRNMYKIFKILKNENRITVIYRRCAIITNPNLIPILVQPDSVNL